MPRQCASAHCSGADAEINDICKSLGWPVNHPVLTRDSQGICVCSCSCLAHGTPVQAGDGSFRSIESFAIGDGVSACGMSLRWAPRTVAFSQGTTGVSRQKYTVLVVYSGTALAVTSDHLFLLADRTLRAADRLAAGDMLMGADGTPVSIVSVHIGDYTAGFHHIATSKAEPPADLDGHLLNTNGVVSGDYAVQLYYRNNDSPRVASLAAVGRSLPIVGSPEYVRKHGDSCLSMPAGRIGGLTVAALDTLEPMPAVFIPAERTRIAVPKDACGFLSEDEARAKRSDAMRAWNDPASREWSEYLIDHHRHFYPEVVFHLDWAEDTVNAYAWVANGVRHVVLKGGLVRHAALELEGIAVVLAHELAHHYGGLPTFPTGLSCEGQADYAGVSRIMRNVWFGDQYITMTDRGIAQMAAFFGVPNSPNAPGGSSGCNHPPGRCRVATYHAAVSLGPKPGCAS